MPPAAAAMIVPLRDLLPDLRNRAGPVPPAAQSALPDGFPDLPEPEPPPAISLVAATASGALDAARLRDGCYLLSFTPAQGRLNSDRWPPAVGTLRVERVAELAFAISGDLYRADATASGPPPPDTSIPMGRGIPSFPREGYLGYLRFGGVQATRLDTDGVPAVDDPALPVPPRPPVPRMPYRALAGKGSVAGKAAERIPLRSREPSLAFAGSFHRLRDSASNLWEPAEPLVLEWTRNPVRSSVLGSDGLRGDATFRVRDASDGHLGWLELEWVSPYFRDAVVELDAEDDLPLPLDNGLGEDWAGVFARAGWRIRVASGTLQSRTPDSGRWSMAALHDALLSSRESADLDGDWRYHVAVVRHFAEAEAPLGVAFDHEAMDLNGVPREGVAINAGAELPADPAYGRYAGRRVFESPELFFQVAVHEIAHAMGLYHNHVGIGITEQVDDLAAGSQAGYLDSEALAPRFVAEDIFRLRHLPDIYVRPGGTGWETGGLVEDRTEAFDRMAGLHLPRPREDEEGALELRLESPEADVPLSAPLRVDFEVVNRSDRELRVPSLLSLATPHVRGWVVGPDGGEHEFHSVFKPVWGGRAAQVAPGGAAGGSMTLLRGSRGALFGRPGGHTLWVEIGWISAGRRWCVRQRQRIEVRPPRGGDDLRATLRLLRTPETLGYLVFGESPRFAAGRLAIDAALDVESLRRHFAFVRAKAVAEPAFGAAADWESIRRLLAPDSHLGPLNRRERQKARTLRERAGLPANAGIGAAA